jgi:hypothetical protein
VALNADVPHKTSILVQALLSERPKNSPHRVAYRVFTNSTLFEKLNKQTINDKPALHFGRSQNRLRVYTEETYWRMIIKHIESTMDENNEEDLFRCAICGTAEGDSSNLTSQASLMTNATVKCGHQL